MFLSESGAGAFGELKNLLLEIAQERELDALLPLIVRRLAETSPDVALARVWLAGPGDSCALCSNAAACASRETCLHLVASAEHPREGGLSLHVRPDSSFRRIPIGAFKVGKVFEKRAAIVVSDAALDPHIARRDWVAAERIHSFAGQPLLYRGQILGVLGVFLRVELPRSAIDVLRLLANHAAAAIAGARAYDEITRLQQRLQRENEYLREVVTSRDSIIVGSSAAIAHLQRQIELVAPTDATVLVTGESGTGKELVAEAIHVRSRRASSPFVRVNCAAIPRELYESEFFGHRKGAFSGAVHERVGRFEAADGGTLFLDEVGEIPHDLQGNLLRVLQEGTFERVGESRPRKADVRIIAATNRNLVAEVAGGRFRQDLYYRLNVFPVETPPLRERPEDLAELASNLVADVCRRMHRAPLTIDPADLVELQDYDWPGNVRELRNVLERAVITTPPHDDRLSLPVLRPTSSARLRAEPAPAATSRGVVREEEVRRFERENLLAAVASAGGRIYGRGGAAELLGIKPTTLASRLKKLGGR